MSANFLRLSLVILVLAAFFLLYIPYRRDIQQAYDHLDSLERQVIETDCGVTEVAIRGDGEPVLVIHGIAGGFDQGLGILQSSLEEGHRAIVPSRFGYLGTPMPVNATPASQADAYICLLDALQLEKVTVLAYSAGGTSALQMALRYPERVKALILTSSAAPSVGKYISLPPKSVIRLMFGSDFLMWGITKHFQAVMKPAIGVPDAYPRTEAQRKIISETIRSILPIERRTSGFVFDMFTSNLDMDKQPELYPMEKIRVPTLIVHAVDDPLAKYENAEALATRIPTAELLSIRSGGHLFLGMEETVRAGIEKFLSRLVDR